MNSSYKWFPHGVVNSSASASTELWNFGQRQWAYAAPAGFKALCTTNLPEPTIADGSTVMDVKLYTGNGSTQTISGLNFSPDLVWAKSRSAATNHGLIDTVRGRGFILVSDLTVADQISPAGADLASFDANGFTLGAPNAIPINVSGQTYAAWTWDAGSSTVTNTDGSITSQVRANASAGFSIVSYTGNASNATVGHGLNTAPEFTILKSRDTANDWYSYHASLGNTKYVSINRNIAAGTFPIWQNTTPTSSVFSIHSGNDANKNGDDFIVYCFAPVAGYSAYGSYTGNGSADGPFVYTGFRPRWVMIKRTNTTGVWGIWDSNRNSFNASTSRLQAESSNAELNQAATTIDILSNGFKPRATDSDINASASTYIYAAFAENPFQSSRAR
jgi:hypothetical protein